MSVVIPPPATEIRYPESDGQPMAETDVHRKLLMDLDFVLRTFFRDEPQVYVAGNLLIYFVEGDPTQSVAPDMFVVKGVPKQDRRIYRVWREGKAPDVVIELTSDSTRADDLGRKRFLYADLGVREYFLFDPLGNYLKPPLRGYRLVGDEYIQMNETPMYSAELGLELHPEGIALRLFDPRTQRYLLTPDETYDEAEREALRADYERTRAERAEAELARVRAELEKLRGGSQA
jgi:Uma2 family endonuclease